MKKIEFLSESGLELGNVSIGGINISEIENFLESIYNESFEYICLHYDEENKILCLEEERGVIFPQYGHFITLITESKYKHCFDFA